MIQQLLNRFAKLVGERVTIVGERLPEPFDRVHVRAVEWTGTLAGCDAVALVEFGARCRCPTPHTLAFPGRMFIGHRVQECLKHLRVAVRHDQADQPAAGRVDRADDVPANVPAVVSPSWAMCVDDGCINVK